MTSTKSSHYNHILLYVALFFAIWALRATLLSPLIEGIQPAWWYRIVSDTIRLLIWVMPVFAYLKWHDKQNPLSYLKLNTPIDWGGVWQSLIVIAIYLIVGRLRPILQGGKLLFSLAYFDQWYKLLLALPMPPLAEEILFRGFFLQQFAQRHGFWKANLLTAILFAFIHWPYWLYTGGFSAKLIATSVSIVLLGGIFGYILKKTNSLWPCLVLHILNNFLSWTITIG